MSKDPFAPIAETIAPLFVVLERVGAGPGTRLCLPDASQDAVIGYSTLEMAAKHRDALANQHHGRTFAVFTLVDQICYKPVAVISTVSNSAGLVKLSPD